MGNERRLGDRILHALEMALDQDKLEVSEHLVRALEDALTDFGGPDVVEKRDLSDRALAVFERLDALRRKGHGL